VTVSPATTTKYYLTAKGANGCERPDSVLVAVRPLPRFAVQPASAVSCQGTPVSLTASGGSTYAWVNNNGVWATTSSVSVQPTTNTLYKVGITDNACNYTDTLWVPVTVSNLPITTVTADSVINCFNTRSRLQVISNRRDDRYIWDAVPGITDLYSATPTVTPEKTTRYYVTITNREGCSKRDSVDVLVDLTNSKSTFSMPNVFTPNGDGQNDCFGLKYWGILKQLDFSIYNRWGGLVFHTTNPNDCWNGRFQGKEQSSGAFVYQIKAVTACGTAYRKGVVTLVK
jgi:gliding motility-associated-like protein